ncbi:MAG: DUF4147 domain-containing protein [Gemmatimonadaceae bacterium]|nr:DUF4147 domain-containing protein [Gemmatimonadaceae bacterium]
MQPRALLTALHDAAVQGAAPFSRTQHAVRQWCEDQQVEPDTGIHVFALGKAAPAMMAGALDALHSLALSAQVHGGIVVSHHLPDSDTWHGVQLPPTIERVTGDHPVPGPASLAAADAIDDAIARISAGDIALVLLSGGTTALCAAPIAALSQTVGDADAAQAQVANLAHTLLEGGLAIHEMNAIRRRVLRFGAGRLAVALHQRGARQIATFAISDVIGDDPAVIGSGPCTPDPFDDATFLALLDAYDLRSQLQRAISTVLGIAGSHQPPAVPAATHPVFANSTYTIVARNADAVQSLADAAHAHGVANVFIDDVPLEGEAAQLGDTLARRALALATRTPRNHTALLVCGGEPVVNLQTTTARAMQFGEDDDARLEEYGETGAPLELRASAADEPMKGGRMQLLAMSAALSLDAAAARGNADAWRIQLLAAGTDGRDGPTDAAGAIIDAATPALARRHGRTPESDIETGRSYYPLDASDALLRTGPTGTNVMDVVAVLITG